VEEFFFADGSRATLVSQEGQLKSLASDCHTLWSVTWTPVLAMVLLWLGEINKSLRIGQFFSVVGKRRPRYNDFELVVMTYGFATFAARAASFSTAFSCAATNAAIWPK
jgi:hypothetical protein